MSKLCSLQRAGGTSHFTWLNSCSSLLPRNNTHARLYVQCSTYPTRTIHAQQKQRDGQKWEGERWLFRLVPSTKSLFGMGKWLWCLAVVTHRSWGKLGLRGKETQSAMNRPLGNYRNRSTEIYEVWKALSWNWGFSKSIFQRSKEYKSKKKKK